MAEKRCRRCAEVKDLDEFRVDLRRNGGHYATCRGCVISRADVRRAVRPPVVSKTCRACRLEKPNEDFGVDRGMRDGLRADCRACRKIAGHGYYSGWSEERKEQQREHGRRWRANNPAVHKAAYTKSMRKRKYGLDEEAYQAMLVAQDYRCAICRQEETHRSGHTHEADALSVDHDHQTNKVRGLLCHRCNRAIGLLADDLARVEAAAAYLRRHKSM